MDKPIDNKYKPVKEENILDSNKLTDLYEPENNKKRNTIKEETKYFNTVWLTGC